MNNKKNIIATIVLFIITCFLAFIPNQFSLSRNQKAYKVRVINVDNTNLEQYGIAKVGQQSFTVEFLTGPDKGRKVSGVNYLMGKMELDTVYKTGDTALATPFIQEGIATNATLIGIYRLNYEFIVLLIFALALLLYAGWIGAKALVSFLFSGMMIWKIMLPLFLKGYNPVIVAFAVVIILSAVILFLIGGFTKKAVAAFVGTVSGIAVTCILALFFTHLFQISGAVKPYTETLLYSGYPHLQITQIFIAGIFMAASGAVMDVSMDVASTIEEVAFHKPDISKKQLILSGFRVGRSVIGTMTTTLLLAYSSSYMGLLMVFMAQGTPLIQIVNLNYVAAEILNTILGSFSLVLTAPLTALAAGILYGKSEKMEGSYEITNIN
ncbi:MAG: hypothetical protein BKP49_10275 [Treponema sp. CETP13]|nr:MAG: hypothetical protein BKP49_10275 [Treponema sp. CETP13]